MSADRAAYDRIFSAANTRLAELDLDRCREIESEQVRALRGLPPTPAMLRELIRDMRTQPASEAWRERCHFSMRRVYARLQKEQQRPEVLQTALNAYLDGQTELAARWMDLDTLLRPWGER